MTLHIIKSASADVISRLPDIISDEDQILLIEDACYLHSIAQQTLVTQASILALTEHMQTRGLLAKAQASGIRMISFKEWVLLTHKHPQAVTW